MNNLSVIFFLVFVMSCNKISDRFGFGSNDSESEEQSTPHPFEVTEQEEQGESMSPQAAEQQDQQVAQKVSEGQVELPQQSQPSPGSDTAAGLDSKFACTSNSPALVIFDRESQSFFYCDRGTWSPASLPTGNQVNQKQGNVPGGSEGGIGLSQHFVIRPQTDSFLCTQSENFPKSYICSKKDRVLKKKGYQKEVETTLTEGP
ncbi:MAG: hypothetical protein HRU09_01695 [Oligoflexales bacterium]|nr:hypothetical protein [Oligoflexales bacterium]